MKKFLAILLSILLSVCLTFSSFAASYCPPPASLSGTWLWPVPKNASIYSPYKQKGRVDHVGLDISKNADLAVVATRTGKVVGVSYTGTQNGTACFITLEHIVEEKSYCRPYYSTYAHLKSGSIVYYSGAKKGQQIKKGDTIYEGTQIGITGKTGNATGVHLHFQISSKIHGNGLAHNDYTINVNPYDKYTPVGGTSGIYYKYS